MSRCNKKRQWMVTNTTRATFLLEEILTNAKDLEGEQMQSYKAAITSALTGLRMIRYFSIPYDPDKPCSLEVCCRKKKASYWYADDPEFPCQLD